MKFILCGDNNVGKTTLRMKYTQQTYDFQYTKLIGMDISGKNIPSIKGRPINPPLQCFFWEISGKIGFTEIRRYYYAGTNGVMLIFDCTNRNSYENILYWMAEIQISIGISTPVILIGNKIDLRDKVPNSLQSKDGEDLANKISTLYFHNKMVIPYYETSAKTGQNVDNIYEEIINLVVSKFMY